jgi:anaerobic ribonucleoside-triphosphate reductase
MSPCDSSAILGKLRVTTPKLQRPLFSFSPCSALECSTKRMYPDILNYDKIVELLGDFKAPMGCRSFLPSWRNVYILKHRASTSFCDKNFSKTLSCHLVIQARFLVNELLGDFKAPMGCRSFLPSWRNEQGENENNGRCNLGYSIY